MKKLYALLFIFVGFLGLCQVQVNVSYTITPTTFDEDETITITFTDIDEAAWGVSSSHALYLWAWIPDSPSTPNNGDWGNSDEASKLTYVSPGTYEISLKPTEYYGVTGITQIALLLKNKNGSTKSQDILVSVGKFQLTLIAPTPQPGNTTVVSPGSSYNIQASTSLPATFTLKSNESVLETTTVASTDFSYTYTVNEDSAMELIATDASDPSHQESVTFSLIPEPDVQTAPMPAYMQQGINYNPEDNTKVGLALYAPHKDFVHVIGSFNNWTPNASYLMKRSSDDPDVFWIEIDSLIPQEVYTFQYRTNDGVKVADPFSPIVLSPDDDPYISATTYPNLPPYPAGQQYDVSVIQTGMPQYQWTTTHYQRPDKNNLIVYEVLVRDFTEQKNWQSMIDKLDYIKELNVNAIELLPIMEFDGNNSWGYNPGFHYALDKAYGTPDKFKEFVDKAHAKGLSIILDIALNHATGRSPIERLWSTSPDGSYGDVAANNPYFNQVAPHAYNYFYDLNHSSDATRYYVKRVLEHWINEYKIDGFRWDLTKGFTQNCSSNDESCTNAYQQDRVDVLKLYADYQWAADPDSFVIFEHLGDPWEEMEWANYRISEGKGIMPWDKLTDPYNQNTMGYVENSNFDRVNYTNHGYVEPRNMSFAESHDEERLMFKNLEYGASYGSYDIKTLKTALKRQEAIGAVLLAVPGPKMIWQFGELGYDFSINRCEDGTINSDCRTAPKPVAFQRGYDHQADRLSIYNTWAKILELRLSNKVFNTKSFSVESGDLMPRIYIWDDDIPVEELKNVVIIANFTTTTQNIVPYFPFAGNWVNLMDESVLPVTQTDDPITIEAGGFRIYGNAPTVLGTEETENPENSLSLKLAQNPIVNHTAIIQYKNAENGVLYFYDLSGKLVKTVKAETKSGNQSIPLGGFKSGLYLIQLKTDKGTAVTKMMVP